MIAKRYVQTIVIILFCSCSCAPRISYKFITSENSNIQKVFFGQDKDVIELNAFGQHETFFLHHDFSFRKKLIINLSDARVIYKGYRMHLNFIGNDIKKDWLHIDGDDNILTVFSIPFKIQNGDTITLRLDKFLTDEDGKIYNFEPIYFVASEVRKK